MPPKHQVTLNRHDGLYHPQRRTTPATRPPSSTNSGYVEARATLVHDSVHVEEVVVKRVIERYTGCHRRRRGVRCCGIRAGMGRLWLVRPSSSPAGLHSSRTQHAAADPNDWVMIHPQQRQWPASLSQETRRWTATELAARQRYPPEPPSSSF
ncbi:hypothetical protein B0H34DRAFT_127118 [Crassisporium funariophilum]|nr:hypothetical protein B0H34DRAFT_127118 [Crassisporium funariophilum]